MMDGEVHERVTWNMDIKRLERKKRMQYYLKARAAESCRAAEGYAKEVEDDAAILEETDVHQLSKLIHRLWWFVNIATPYTGTL